MCHLRLKAEKLPSSTKSFRLTEVSCCARQNNRHDKRGPASQKYKYIKLFFFFCFDKQACIFNDYSKEINLWICMYSSAFPNNNRLRPKGGVSFSESLHFVSRAQLSLPANDLCPALRVHMFWHFVQNWGCNCMELTFIVSLSLYSCSSIVRVMRIWRFIPLWQLIDARCLGW